MLTSSRVCGMCLEALIVEFAVSGCLEEWWCCADSAAAVVVAAVALSAAVVVVAQPARFDAPDFVKRTELEDFRGFVVTSPIVVAVAS